MKLNPGWSDAHQFQTPITSSKLKLLLYISKSSSCLTFFPGAVMYTAGRVSGPVRCGLFDPWVWQGLSLPVHFQCWLSLTVTIQSPHTITCHNKNPRVGGRTRSTIKDGMWLPKKQRNWKQPHTYLVLPGYKEEHLYTYIYIHTHTYTLVYIIQIWKWWVVFNRKKWKSLSSIVRLRESSSSRCLLVWTRKFFNCLVISWLWVWL